MLRKTVREVLPEDFRIMAFGYVWVTPATIHHQLRASTLSLLYSLDSADQRHETRWKLVELCIVHRCRPHQRMQDEKLIYTTNIL